MSGGICDAGFRLPERTAVGVVAVVRRGGDLLLVLSEDRGWEPPGGFVEDGEAIVDAIVREVMEEAAVLVRPIRLTGVYQCIRECPILSLVFDCVLIEETAAVTQESLAVSWVPLSDVDAKLTYEPHRLRIRDALDVPGAIAFRQYRPAPFFIEASATLPQP